MQFVTSDNGGAGPLCHVWGGDIRGPHLSCYARLSYQGGMKQPQLKLYFLYSFLAFEHSCLTKLRSCLYIHIYINHSIMTFSCLVTLEKSQVSVLLIYVLTETRQCIKTVLSTEVPSVVLPVAFNIYGFSPFKVKFTSLSLI